MVWVSLWLCSALEWLGFIRCFSKCQVRFILRFPCIWLQISSHWTCARYVACSWILFSNSVSLRLSLWLCLLLLHRWRMLFCASHKCSRCESVLSEGISGSNVFVTNSVSCISCAVQLCRSMRSALFCESWLARRCFLNSSQSTSRVCLGSLLIACLSSRSVWIIKWSLSRSMSVTVWSLCV